MIGKNLTFFENDERLISIFHTQLMGKNFDLLDNSLHFSTFTFLCESPTFIIIYICKKNIILRKIHQFELCKTNKSLIGVMKIEPSS